MEYLNRILLGDCEDILKALPDDEWCAGDLITSVRWLWVLSEEVSGPRGPVGRGV